MTRPSLLACLTLAAVACGSSTDSKSGNQDLAGVYCAEVAKCCAQVHLSSNGSVCRFMLSGGSSDPAASSACLAEVQAQSAAGTFCSSSSSTSSACNAAFGSGGTGNKKPGDTCTQDGDCASSSDGNVACASLYDDSKETWIYKCQVQMRGQVGDVCLGTRDGAAFWSNPSDATDIPARGYVCDTADGVECKAGTCAALAALGQSCGDTSDCVRTAYCDQTAHCAARVSAGAACTGADSDECLTGFYCPDASPRQCTAQVGTFTSCTSDAMCSSGSCASGSCQPNAFESIGWALLCS